ncbi:MAG TPA: DUF362 domain-containing protein [Terriglobales bacterium]|nr:DUF362 domain-containing protein [Terriglobales bacterium]
MTMTRREFLATVAAVSAGVTVSAPFFRPRYRIDRRPGRSRVVLLRLENYSRPIDELLFLGLRLFPINVQGKTVLLKPNLVDYIPGNAINTHPRLVMAAAEAFRRLGARNVVVGEGAGHQRDTELVLFESGYERELQLHNIPFVDLNRDELLRLRLGASYTDLEYLWLPKAVLASEFIVSMPKVKTHHWSGVTLSLKNMLGVVPGNKYGWPKNILHWQGIQQSVLDVCATVPIHFVIADAVIAMEGNGPLNGSPRPLGMVVLADDPVAADASCARLMGFEPGRIPHIREASRFLGNSSPVLIDQAGEVLRRPEMPFQVVPHFQHIRAI